MACSEHFARADKLARQVIATSSNPKKLAQAWLARAETMTQRAQVLGDQTATLYSTVLGGQAWVRAHKLDLEDPNNGALAVNSSINLIEANLYQLSILEAVGIGGYVPDRNRDDARWCLDAARMFAEGLPSDLSARTSLRILGLTSWLRELEGGKDNLREALDCSRLAIQRSLELEDPAELVTNSLRFGWQAIQRASHGESSAVDEGHTMLVNGLANCAPTSPSCFSLLGIWAHLLYVGGEHHSRRDLMTVASIIWEACCNQLMRQNPILCVDLAKRWSWNAEMSEGPGPSVPAYDNAIRALRALTFDGGAEGCITPALAMDSDTRPAAIAALAIAGQTKKAIEVAEQGRSLRRQGMTALPISELRQLAATGRPDLAHRYLHAHAIFEQAVHKGEGLYNPVDQASLNERETALRELHGPTMRVQRVSDMIRACDAFERFPSGLSVDEIAEVAVDAPLVYVVTGLKSGCLLILTPDGEILNIPVPALDQSADGRAMQFRQSYLDWRRGKSGIAAWSAELDELGGWLGQVFLGPMLNAVGDVPFVRVVPLSRLGLLPLHLAWIQEGGAPRYALERMTLSNIPSAALRRLASRRPKAESWCPLVIEGPDLAPEAAELEIQTLLQRFSNAVALRGDAINPQAVRDRLQACNLAHISAHGALSVDQPSEGGFRLARGETVRLREIRRLPLEELEVLILSSCESAMISDLVLDESYGLAGMLYGTSAAVVVAAQWAVDQLATAKVFDGFYRHWDLSHDVRAIGDALRQAQLDVRESSYSEAIWWGGFAISG
jgi:hypothetical protein